MVQRRHIAGKLLSNRSTLLLLRAFGLLKSWLLLLVRDLSEKDFELNIMVFIRSCDSLY